jgi:cytochrome P450
MGGNDGGTLNDTVHLKNLLILCFCSIVVITDYPSIENLMLKQHNHLDRSAATVALFEGILPTAQISLLSTPMWKHHRRIIGPAMSSKYLSLTTPRANESIKMLIEYWRIKQKSSGGKAWHATVDLEGATMDTICGMAFGATWGILESFMEQIGRLQPQVGKLGEAVYPVTRPDLAISTLYLFDKLPTETVFPKLYHLYMSSTPKWRKCYRQVSTYLDKKLSDARVKAKAIGVEAAVEQADNTLDMMVAREMKGEDWMPDQEMKDEVYQYLLAGTETSSTTLSWWLKYMTNHPKVQVKLRKHLFERLPSLELDEGLHLTYQDLTAENVPYLEAVVHETLRLSRTASGFARGGECCSAGKYSTNTCP